MAAINGVNITGVLSPTDTLDTYAVIDPAYGIDGWRSVANLNELNAITTPRRRQGMIAYVISNSTAYQLLAAPWTNTISDWSILSLSGGSGTQGPQGLFGPQGYGLQGYFGVQGINGVTGPQGNSGTQGAVGINSVTKWSVSTASLLTTLFRATLGDIAVAQDTGGVYVLTTGSYNLMADWIEQGITTVVGPQGNIGAIGPQGFTGSQGYGLQGFTGLQGTQGFTGPQGYGLTGVQGIGLQGLIGATGPQGFTGSGVQGVQGPSLGPVGPQGVQGQSGASIIGYVSALKYNTTTRTTGSSVQADPELYITLQPNTMYDLNGLILENSNATNTASCLYFGWNWTGSYPLTSITSTFGTPSTTTTSTFTMYGQTITTTYGSSWGRLTVNNLSGTSSKTDNAIVSDYSGSTPYVDDVTVQGTVQTGNGGGILTLCWYNSGSNTVSFLPNSFISIIPIATQGGGIQGAAGPQGFGVPGVQGVQGPSLGPIGPVGPQGPWGGPQGVQGANGLSGTSGIVTIAATQVLTSDEIFTSNGNNVNSGTTLTVTLQPGSYIFQGLYELYPVSLNGGSGGYLTGQWYFSGQASYFMYETNNNGGNNGPDFGGAISGAPVSFPQPSSLSGMYTGYTWLIPWWMSGYIVVTSAGVLSFRYGFTGATGGSYGQATLKAGSYLTASPINSNTGTLTGYQGLSGPQGPANGPAGPQGLNGPQGSAPSYTFLRTTSAYTTTSTTVVTDPVLSNIYLNPGTYIFDLSLPIMATRSTNTFLLGFSFSGTTTQFTWNAGTYQWAIVALPYQAQYTISGASSYDTWVYGKGMIVVTTAGYFAVQVGIMNTSGYTAGDSITRDVNGWILMTQGIGSGPQGFTGFQGLAGYQGFTGIQGSSGAGFQGNVGFQGNIGFQGNTGVPGPIGSLGNTGPQGNTGVQGNIGNTGVQGNDGAIGLQGFSGIQGKDGYVGGAGFQGFQGPDGIGLQGFTGLQGVLGLQGNNGVQGYGLQGFSGPQGRTGVGGPQGFLGLPGAIGPTGATGNDGPQGYGSQGLSGLDGLDGSTGPQGLQGAIGLQGNGLQGALGPTGNDGSTGGFTTVIATFVTPALYTAVDVNVQSTSGLAPLTYVNVIASGLNYGYFLVDIPTGPNWVSLHPLLYPQAASGSTVPINAVLIPAGFATPVPPYSILPTFVDSTAAGKTLGINDCVIIDVLGTGTYVLPPSSSMPVGKMYQFSSSATFSTGTKITLDGSDKIQNSYTSYNLYSIGGHPYFLIIINDGVGNWWITS